MAKKGSRNYQQIIKTTKKYYDEFKSKGYKMNYFDPIDTNSFVSIYKAAQLQFPNSHNLPRDIARQMIGITNKQARAISEAFSEKLRASSRKELLEKIAKLDENNKYGPEVSIIKNLMNKSKKIDASGNTIYTINRKKLEEHLRKSETFKTNIFNLGDETFKEKKYYKNQQRARHNDNSQLDEGGYYYYTPIWITSP